MCHWGLCLRFPLLFKTWLITSCYAGNEPALLPRNHREERRPDTRERRTASLLRNGNRGIYDIFDSERVIGKFVI